MTALEFPKKPLKLEEEIFESEIYTVMDEVKDASGNDYYRLHERSFDMAYLKRRFAPLSDIDETEMTHSSQLNEVI